MATPYEAMHGACCDEARRGKTLVPKPSKEEGTTLHQQCTKCRGKFKSTLRVAMCPVSRGCHGRTIVTWEE